MTKSTTKPTKPTQKAPESIKSVIAPKVSKTPALFLVVPCYNESEALPDAIVQLTKKLDSLITKKLISKKSQILFVDDGSSDETWQLIKSASEKDERITGLKLSHNRGHQNALVAGLLAAKSCADVVISIDADLQDDIDAIDKMLEEYKNGADVVYGVRSDRSSDSAFKRKTAESYYKFLKALSVDLVYNSADFRLTSKKVLTAFADYHEVNLFLRGLFPLIGFKTAKVYYSRKPREKGESKYPLKKMLALAWDGITSFSIQPIRLVLKLGIIITIIATILIIYSIVRYFINQTVPGWAFLSCSIWFLGGVQMLSIGLIGEYIGKTYSESKARPRYHIEENLLESPATESVKSAAEQFTEAETKSGAQE